jgi:hypothetical protein
MTLIWWGITSRLLVVVLIAFLGLKAVGAQPASLGIENEQERHLDSLSDTEVGFESQGMAAERKAKRLKGGTKKTPPKSVKSANSVGTVQGEPLEQFSPEYVAQLGTLEWTWHQIVMTYMYPFRVITESAGPMAANAFGIGLAGLLFMIPRLFKSTR